MLTEGELENLREQHVDVGDDLGCGMCYLESNDWPCLIRRLVDEIERQAAEIQGLKTAMAGVTGHYNAQAVSFEAYLPYYLLGR